MDRIEPRLGRAGHRGDRSGPVDEKQGVLRRSAPGGEETGLLADGIGFA